ncbi:MAG: carbohydrate kinase family protein [Lachnospiraceae bacterium]|jgi:sugar/nucleoside kinase (ribokinase family)|nr:carbohydrate kinase family protein [Lachnospiraceae bacterium]
MKQDIVLAGNILVDIVKTVDSYPQLGMLANISSVKQAVGGCVPNTAIDLAKMDSLLRLGAIGRVGQDAYGDYALSQLREHGIDTSRISRSAASPTSFSDVMSLPSGERTFFHARGANAEFAPEQVELENLQCDMLHAGYLMLLDGFDAEDATYGTQMAHFLHDVQAQGIRTSVDAVSSASADYQRTVLPALRYCDYVIVNEIESCGIWHISPRRTDGTLDIAAVRGAMEKMAESGVGRKVVVHSKEAGLCLDVPTGAFTLVPSLDLPADQIAGSVGAGDAFCAGCLYGLWKGYGDEELLVYASAAAACNLSAENAVDGLRSVQEIWQMASAYPRREIC